MPTHLPEHVPDIVIGRLPLYLRALEHLVREGREITSSQELGERLGYSAAQIRKDLSFFGEFGKQGSGYRIAYLAQELRKILKVDRERLIVLVGVGDLGHALARYGGLKPKGFAIAAAFDNDPAKIGQKVGNLVVRDSRHIAEDLKGIGAEIAIIATPADRAQEVANVLVEAGIRAIVNYAPISIQVPKGVRVQYVDPAVQLQRLAYYL
jgi:redox-sensing transcriptional repressor